MQRFRTDPGHYGTGFPVIGINSGAFDVADALYVDSSGWVGVVTTSSKVLGYSTHQQTLEADNQTVDKVTPLYVSAPGVQMQYTADQDAIQTDVGAYADLVTITSGAQVLNLLAGSNGQFFVLGFDPDDESDDDEVVVEVAEPQVLAFAQV